MALVSFNEPVPKRISVPSIAANHPLRPVLFTVFGLKLVVAVFLIGCASIVPPVSAQSGYSSLD
ncbi:hypothetical protein [Rhizobium sp. SSA_523]|uniref:hypothetical protein n=1 Tax=Rhizobium sp. SSA_523 TaxID=2952477 RepID=UPI0020919FC6|nr:hypothetical protein [Rhizobium sp. SSA_523]MCO5730394.1 hypothetical protein [Rhizobium sp. SSA_523]WKC25438.1 hypothetical protein QTJ18_15860 [Rhizobium sp. SSA_523]